VPEVFGATKVISGGQTTRPHRADLQEETDLPDIIPDRRQELAASAPKGAGAPAGETRGRLEEVPAVETRTRASPRDSQSPNRGKATLPAREPQSARKSVSPSRKPVGKGIRLLNPKDDDGKFKAAMTELGALRGMSTLGLLQPWLNAVVTMKQFEYLSLATEEFLEEQAVAQGMSVEARKAPRLAMVVALTMLQRDTEVSPLEVAQLRSSNLHLGAHMEMVDWKS